MFVFLTDAPTLESEGADFLVKNIGDKLFYVILINDLDFQPPIQSTEHFSFGGVKILVKLFSNAERCKSTAITSSDPNNKLLLLSFGTNFISDIQLNVVEKLFALNL